MVILKRDGDYLSKFIDLSHVSEIELQGAGNGLHRIMGRCYGSNTVLSNEMRVEAAQQALRSIVYLKAYGEPGCYKLGIDGEMIRVSIDALVGDVVGPPVL